MATNLTRMMAQSQDFSTTKSHESGHEDYITYQTCHTCNSAKPMASKLGRTVAQIEISFTLSLDIPLTKLHELPIMIRFYLQSYIHKAYGADGNFLQSVSKKKLLRSFHSTFYQDDFSVFYGNKSISLLGPRIRGMIQDSLKKS